MNNRKFDVLTVAVCLLALTVFIGSVITFGNHPLTVVSGLILGLLFLATLLVYDDSKQSKNK